MKPGRALRVLPFLLAFNAFSFSALAEGAPTPPPKKPLYQRLGGKEKIRQATAHLLDVLSQDQRLMKNPELKQLTRSLKRAKLVNELTERVCAVSGGPCRLVPGALDRLGPKLEVSPMDWVYLLQDLNATLEKFKIPRAEQAEFAALILRYRNKPINAN